MIELPTYPGTNCTWFISDIRYLQSSDLFSRSNALCKLCLKVVIFPLPCQQTSNLSNIANIFEILYQQHCIPLNQVELKMSIFWTNFAKFSSHLIIIPMFNIHQTTLNCQSLCCKCKWHIFPNFVSGHGFCISFFRHTSASSTNVCFS